MNGKVFESPRELQGAPSLMPEGWGSLGEKLRGFARDLAEKSPTDPLHEKLLSIIEDADRIESIKMQRCSLEGKRVLVTGSSQGIGYAVAYGMLAAGAKVVLNSFEQSLSDGRAAALYDAGFKEGKDFHYVQADLAGSEGPTTLVRSAASRLGGLDVLVNNVGTYRDENLEQLTAADFDRLYALNVRSHFLASQEFVRIVGKRDFDAAILFTGSLNGLQAETRHTLYDGTKGAVIAMARSLSVELAALGIRCNCIAPGLIATPLTDNGIESDPPLRKLIELQIPARRIGVPMEVAGAYVFLASDQAKYVTGQTLVIDGGISAEQLSYRQA